MKVHGLSGLTPQQLADEVLVGGKFVRYQWCYSLLIKTFQQGTDVYYIRPGQNAVRKGFPWSLLTFLVGWWGFPMGLVYTPIALSTNLSGGKEVTHAVMTRIMTEPSTTPLGSEYVLGTPLTKPW